MKSKDNNILSLNTFEKMHIFFRIYFIFIIIGEIFFKNIIVSFIVGFFSIPIVKIKIKHIEKEKINQLLYEFKCFLNVYLSACLTGDEPFSAYKFAYYELKRSNTFKSILIYKLEDVIRKTSIYMDFGKNLIEFSNELKIREIEIFAKCADVTIKTTGNMEEILIETIEIITNKLEADTEIRQMFYDKKYELKIMTFVPILIYTFLSITAKEYIMVLYKNGLGMLILSIALTLIMISYIVGERMMDVELEN